MGREAKLETHAVMEGDCVLTLRLPPKLDDPGKLQAFLPIIDRFEECVTKENPAERLVRHERELLRLFLLWVSSDGPKD